MLVPVAPTGAEALRAGAYALNQALRVQYPGKLGSACAYVTVGALLGLIAWVLTNPVPVPGPGTGPVGFRSTS